MLHRRSRQRDKETRRQKSRDSWRPDRRLKTRLRDRDRSSKRSTASRLRLLKRGPRGSLMNKHRETRRLFYSWKEKPKRGQSRLLLLRRNRRFLKILRLNHRIRRSS